MDLIIRKEFFDTNRIGIKHGRNAKKIIYNLDYLSMIGISFEVREYIIVNQSNKYLFIDIEESMDKDIFIKIDQFFKNKYKPYKSFMDNYILKVKKHKSKTFKKNDPLFVSFNNIKTKNSLTKLQLFTI